MDPWQPLNTSDQQIRLLEVAPRNKHANNIECRLKTVSLVSDPAYEALSYVWGGWENSQEILLDGLKHTVTKNLHDALSIMQLSDEPRTLWVCTKYIGGTSAVPKTNWNYITGRRSLYRPNEHTGAHESGRDDGQGLLPG